MTTNNLQTELLGAHVEIKERGAGTGSSWYDDRDSGRGELVGVIRSVGIAGDGNIIMQIEDREGWIHTRSSHSHTYRIDHVKSALDKLAQLSQAYGGYQELKFDGLRADPYRQGAAIVLQREPTKEERERFKLAFHRMLYNAGDNRVRYAKPPDRRELGDLKIGDRFRFVSAPEGWTDQKLLIVEKSQGWAAPEGWDYLVWPPPDSIRKELVELLKESAPVTGGPFVPEEE